VPPSQYVLLTFDFVGAGLKPRARTFNRTLFTTLTRIIREVEGAKSLLCYKHVVETVLAATQEASA